MGKIIYFDCNAGISGDMTLGALIHLGADPAKIKSELMTMALDPFDLIPHGDSVSGISGISLEVALDRDDSHTHRTFGLIRGMIESSGIAHAAKERAIASFAAIAKAEAAVHDKPVDEVAFHEVGAMDSIIDIVGMAVAMDMLGNPRVFCGPLHDGHGFIECRHGVIPVPVPAVVEMLTACGLPIVIESDVGTEMVTPTGLGILMGSGAEFRPNMGLRAERAGYGFGKRKTKEFNGLRAIMGEEFTE